MGTKIEPIEDANGHVFFPGADSMGRFEEGAFFYMVSYTWQDGPNSMRSGAHSVHGLVYPADKVQYGKLVNDILSFVRTRGMGAPGFQVINFFHIMPHTEYRDPLVVQQEQADRAETARKELSA